MVFPLPYHSTSIPGAVFRLGLGAQTDTDSVLPVCRALSCGIITARFCEDENSVAERDSSEISRVLSVLGIRRSSHVCIIPVCRDPKLYALCRRSVLRDLGR